ncbi:hypothetical protein GLAREA_09411 [Glarea lozoyensis ATCC 20868]|uniref:Uncharacterized protein n=1 Tax=Glarea lozoyensis (strain ATCC 20868 / MF5171) TaxID=1116229 RepID=S3D8I0_GLAL2|nr:uncharacterized protein GLAREA_09411 [Glarea lozoyensis ATCC 20868]EPE28291.1 hypothetical protein GLAREA_09411 [Glarea lozoyensis ATCC 20868]
MLARIFTTGLLASQATAGAIGNGGLFARKDHSMEEVMRRYVDSIIDPIERRQETTAQIPTMNITQWDEATTAACTTSLEALNGRPSNPSGMAVCYNLPFLNETTGIFQADLRLYMVGAPTGDFANIASQNVNVGLSYSGATVQAINATTMTKRSDDSSLISWPRAVEMSKRQTQVPQLAQAYAFVGQVNRELLATPGGTTSLQNILVPTVTLTAMNATGQLVNTTLSSQEATFVNGVFATQVVPTKSQVAPPIQTLVIKDGSTFVVPGLNILIFPIGGIITGTWALLFVGVVGWGTVGRMQFREQYRRRRERAAGGKARI